MIYLSASKTRAILNPTIKSNLEHRAADPGDRIPLSFGRRVLSYPLDSLNALEVGPLFFREDGEQLS